MLVLPNESESALSSVLGNHTVSSLNGLRNLSSIGSLMAYWDLCDNRNRTLQAKVP